MPEAMVYVCVVPPAAALNSRFLNVVLPSMFWVAVNFTVEVLAVKVPFLSQPPEMVSVRLESSSVRVPPVLMCTVVTVALVSSVTVWVFKIRTVSVVCGVVPPQPVQVPAADQLPVALELQSLAYAGKGARTSKKPTSKARKNATRLLNKATDIWRKAKNP